MKNISTKLAFVLAAVIIILIAVIVWVSNKNTGEPTLTAGQTASSTVAPSGSSAPSAVKPTGQTISPNLNYKDYITQLRSYQDACKTAATAQYNQLYGSLGSGSYNNYFNQTNGICYMRASGTTKETYGTTTTAHIYFRNVTAKALIAECVDTTGTMADTSWVCTNKLSGATINKTAFEALVSSYTTVK
jgi:hypothetical protein